MSQMDIAWALREAALDLAAVRRAVRHTSGVAMNDTLQQRARGMAKQFDGGDEDDVRGEFIRELADRLDALEADLKAASDLVHDLEVKLAMSRETSAYLRADKERAEAERDAAREENARLREDSLRLLWLSRTGWWLKIPELEAEASYRTLSEIIDVLMPKYPDRLVEAERAALAGGPPKRIQRRRTKGWRMPPNTVYVGRPSKWGNPWTPEAYWAAGYSGSLAVATAAAVEMFRSWITGTPSRWNGQRARLYEPRGPERNAPDISVLRGKDLACWCPLDQPCHADILLEIANATDGALAGGPR